MKWIHQGIPLDGQQYRASGLVAYPYAPTPCLLRADFCLSTVLLGLTDGVRFILGHTNKVPKTVQRCSNDLFISSFDETHESGLRPGAAPFDVAGRAGDEHIEALQGSSDHKDTHDTLITPKSGRARNFKLDDAKCLCEVMTRQFGITRDR